MATVLICGGSGMLGATLAPALRAFGQDVRVHGRNERAELQGDFTDYKTVARLIGDVKPQVIINLIGLTNVDRCEAEPNSAYRANVLVAENIVRWMKSADSCHLVQISTDQIYDGQGPHEEDRVTLTNYYAFSKYAGELAAAVVPSTILRTNFFGRSRSVYRQSLTDWLYDSLGKRAAIPIFDDVLFSPLSMTTLSAMVNRIIAARPIGTFNLGARAGMSKADFAVRFAAEIGLPSDSMIRTTTGQVAFLKTYRPKDMRMDPSRFEAALGIRFPSLADELRQVAAEYRNIEFTKESGQ